MLGIGNCFHHSLCFHFYFVTKKSHDDTSEAKLESLSKYLKALDCCLIIRTKNTGSWLTVQVTMVNGTVLAATEFCDICARVMMLHPPTLKKLKRLLFILLLASWT